MDDDATLRRELAEAIRQRGVVSRRASVETMEAILQRMQERGEITLRRHDGQVVLIWERQ